MGEKTYASVAEIDAALEAEFAKVNEMEVEDDEEEEFDDEEEEEFEGFGDDEEEETEDDEEEEEEKPTAKKPSKAEKEEFTFAQLRQQAKLAEQKAAEEQAFMRKLAKASGYGDDVAKYRKDLEARLIEQEASQHGVTPEVYKELSEAKAKLQSFQQEREEEQRIAKSQAFLKTINKVLKEYDVDQKAMSKELFDTLEKSGYTIDALLSVPNPEFLIRGALYDKLSKAQVKQSRIRDGLDTRKIKSSSGGVKTMEEMIEQEMVEYAKARGLKYSK